MSHFLRSTTHIPRRSIHNTVTELPGRYRTKSMAYPTNPSPITDLLSALPTKFSEAKQSGQLFFFPSQAKDVYSNGKRVGSRTSGYLLYSNDQFNIRSCPALLDKQKAKEEALAEAQSESTTSPDHKRQKREEVEKVENKQNATEPFRPPYVPELYLGCLEGIENEPGMSILVCFFLRLVLCPS